MKSILSFLVLALSGFTVTSVIPVATATEHAQIKSMNEAGTKGPFATKQAAVDYGVGLGKAYFFHVYEENGTFFCAYRKRPRGF